MKFQGGELVGIGGAVDVESSWFPAGGRDEGEAAFERGLLGIGGHEDGARDLSLKGPADAPDGVRGEPFLESVEVRRRFVTCKAGRPEVASMQGGPERFCGFEIALEERCVPHDADGSRTTQRAGGEP